MLQCVAVCCIVLQCAVCCSTDPLTSHVLTHSAQQKRSIGPLNNEVSFGKEPYSRRALLQKETHTRYVLLAPEKKKFSFSFPSVRERKCGCGDANFIAQTHIHTHSLTDTHPHALSHRHTSTRTLSQTHIHTHSLTPSLTQTDM